MNNFSIFEYLYRDASNYKVWGTLILQGTSTASDLEVLKSSFESGEFFIAEQLGIPPLYADLWAFSDGPSIDDHVWHSFHALRMATEEDITEPIFGTVEDLISKIGAVKEWEPELSPHWDI
jgi:hypothetical protein